MGKVKILDSLVADMIAAGEVVERPSSVVKELAENAIDAGAGKIVIEISKGGIELIRVTDDGSGFAPDDLPTAFMRHATSKIESAEDLFSINTMGFRGEALASIAAVSKVEVISKQRADELGSYIKISAGDIEDFHETGCPDGTTMTVRNLFYNVPARMKFLKKDSAEGAAAYDAVVALALGHPEISFRFISDGKEKLHTPGDGDLKSCIYSVYGAEYASNIKELDFSENGIKISGYCGNENLSRSTRGYQTFFVNGRVFKSRSITFALEQGYQDAVMKGKYPFAVIKISIAPFLCDVNVHPAKTEVRFADEKKVTSAVYWAVKNAIFKRAEYIPVVEETHEEERVILREPRFVPTEKKEEIKPPVMYKRAEKKVQPEKTDDFQKPVRAYEEPSASEELPPVVQEEFFEAEVTKNEDIKIIGQLFGTYIAAEQGDEFILIDQHASHERINFEKLLVEREREGIHSQTLISPPILGFSASEHDEILGNKEIFSDIGFEIDDFGDNSIIIRSAPVVSEHSDIETVFREVIPSVCSAEVGRARGEAESEALYSIACHGSVRANQQLSVAEMKELVKKIAEIPSTCPHGRPVKITITKKEIEKMFKRIV